MRPKNLDEFVGQEHLVGKNGIIRRMIESKSDFSIIFWGPPGTGKTTLAQIIANEIKADFHYLEAVTTGKSDLLRVVEKAEENHKKILKQFCLSTKFIGGTRHNKTLFYHT